jgi:hypothetical protein
MAFDPVFFLHLKRQVHVFLTDANYMGRNTLFVGVDSIGFWGNLWWYATGAIAWGAGTHIALLAVCGVVIALWQKRRENAIVMAFPLLYLIVLGRGKFKWERYAVTLMPFVALYAGLCLHALMKKLAPRLSPVVRSAVPVTCAGLAVLVPIYNIIRYDYLLTQKDTRSDASEWICAHLPTGTKLAQDAYTGVLPDSLFDITRRFSLGNETLEYYVKNGYDYLLVSDTQYRRYLAKPQKNPNHTQFYGDLFSKAELVREFVPREDLWPKPDVRFPKYHIHISPRICLYGLGTGGKE